MTLEDTLADLRERVTMLRVEGHPVQAASVERAIEQLVACLPEYLVMLSEQEAVTYSPSSPPIPRFGASSHGLTRGNAALCPLETPEQTPETCKRVASGGGEPMSARSCPSCGQRKKSNALACVRCRPRVKPLLGRTGPNHPAWKGGQRTDDDGYIRLYLPDHPWPRKGGYVLAHVAAMELHLGRRLNPGEVVHHRDHDRQNNALENLELMDGAEHMRQHHANDNRTYRRQNGRFA